MSKILNKLKNNDGMSMLMSMLLVGASTFVSAIILLSASEGFMVKKSDTQSQQAYLTVSSAAQVFRDYIAGASYTNIESQQFDEEGTALGEPVTSESFSMDAAFRPLMSNAIAHVNSRSTAYEKSFTIKVSDLDTVAVNFKMDPENYNIYADFTLAEDSLDNCKMYLTIDARFRDTTSNGWNEEGTVYTTAHKTVVSWKSYSIEKSEEDEE